MTTLLQIVHLIGDEYETFAPELWMCLNLKQVLTICICLCRFFRDFDLVSVLGAGGFGCVVKAKHKLDGNIYAVKILANTI